MLEHGGRRRAAAQRYGIPEADWLDLSTGINPLGYPVPPLPTEVWNRLPEDGDGLSEVAAARYDTTADLLPLAGSQPAIQTLPTLFPRGRVAVLQPSYAEHRHHWTRAGHDVRGFAAGELARVATESDVVVLCNPNNPDGHRFSPDQLMAAAATLAAHGGHLVVDEAFADAQPELSVIAQVGRSADKLIVLRSLGKFYGLAGARVGFMAGPPVLRAALLEAVGPWSLSGPARAVALAALADHGWQAAATARLKTDSIRLAELLQQTLGGEPAVNPLFVWLPRGDAAAIADRLAQRAVLVRHFSTPDCQGLRFGLPGPQPEWQRLAVALKDLA